MSYPLVSVVIPVFNAEEFIADTVESALSQTYPNVEILAVDDGSSDSSAQILSEFGESIRYLSRENGGPAAARNTGISAARGTYIAFLDADDLWEPDKLAAQVELMEHNPEVGLVHTGSVVFDSTREYPFRSKQLPKLMAPSEAFPALFSGNFISTSTVLARSKLFSSLGSFDESMDFFAVEDYDMWLRFACNAGIGFIPEPLLRYRLHAEGISKNINRSYRNETNVINKWYASGSDCLSHLTLKPRDRYANIACAWADDLLWAGTTREAVDLLIRSLKDNGWSWPVAARLAKAQLRRLTT